MSAQTFNVYKDTVISSLTPDLDLQIQIQGAVDKMKRLTVRITTVRMSTQFVFNGITYTVLYYPSTVTPIA